MTKAGCDGSHDGGIYGSAIAAEGWQRGATSRADLRPITERMLALAGIGPGQRVLDVAAGNGEQTLMSARLVGPNGFVLATDIADRLLAYLDEAGPERGPDERADTLLAFKRYSARCFSARAGIGPPRRRASR